jgi:hypothetical protein
MTTKSPFAAKAVMGAASALVRAELSVVLVLMEVSEMHIFFLFILIYLDMSY